MWRSPGLRHLVGCEPRALVEGLRGYRALPHRLEHVATLREVAFYNGSKATNPAAAARALASFEPGRVHLILGGKDKDLPWDNLADLLRERKPKVILFGEAGDLVKRALKNTRPDYPIHQVKKLKDAVVKAAQIAEAGECVLLSPGGTSFDAYRDFEERGEHFRRLVKELK